MKVRLMFGDEAGFGRINRPKKCWAKKGVRPSVPCHHVREYRYAFGAVEPKTGGKFFRVMSHCDSVCMNAFLTELSQEYANDMILLILDGAPWHKSSWLKPPENIVIMHIPPYTPEMNPIEQIWKELRKMGFANICFSTLSAVIDRLCDTICDLSRDTIKSITCRNWISEIV